MILVNGEKKDLPGGLCLSELIAREGLQESRVAVEHNGKIVPRAALSSTILADGDQVEIVHFVGGG